MNICSQARAPRPAVSARRSTFVAPALRPCAQTSLQKCRVAEAAPPEAKSTTGAEKFSGVPVPKQDRPRIIVLGSGWGAISFMKALPQDISDKYEVVLVSPRNYFLYTPLLPAVATGTMEERSIVEPIRGVTTGKGEYYEAVCEDIDPVKKHITACFPKDAGFPEACFRMDYDHLVVSVGSVNNTFGVKGVEENCFFFKSISDASRLRRQISECFERAALPYTPDSERARLLSFVIVGGGPTGVEVAAEMFDMMQEDMSKLYPELMPFVKIRVIELMDYVLSAYDRKLGEYTANLFKRNGIELVLNSRVARVNNGSVVVVDKEDNEEVIDFGACVWATGVAMNPLIKKLQAVMPEQNHFRALLTDEKLRVLGSNGSMWAIGDASTIAAAKALDYADELFESADTDGNGALSLAELRVLLEKASERFPQFQEHARFLSTQEGGISRFGGLVRNFFLSSSKQNQASRKLFVNITDESELSREEFASLLKTIDLGLRGLPATAQVARQQGEWLAESVFGTYAMKEGESLPEDSAEFEYNHKGALAYVGKDRAVMDVPVVGPLWGLGAGFVWKSFETYSQFSWRNKALVTIDWLRTKVFGRDISRV